jgi:hypothetical protein
MANFQGQLAINDAGQRLGFYTWSNTSGAGSYLHFKTNLTLSTYVMSRVEAVGISYANAYPIRCAWTWYTYTYLTNTSVQSIYSGLTADGVYMSSDGYVCFRGYAANNNDMSFTLNATHVNPTGYGYNLTISAASQNSTSGNYY